MGTILESVNNLSEKLGVEEREQTIKDQLDLCVERLGGEGYSVDIAESANKFADKEDGTATFATKSITENGTYAASDDGVSGYSSVTVNVPSGGLDNPTYFMIRDTTKSGPSDPATFTNRSDIVELYQSDNGIVTIPKQVYLEERQMKFRGVIILLGDVNRINVEPLDYTNNRIMIFKAGSDFDGLYINDTKITISDTITAGLWYTLNVENNYGSYDVIIDEQYSTGDYTDSGVIPIS
jgi:hypothetical protein